MKKWWMLVLLGCVSLGALTTGCEVDGDLDDDGAAIKIDTD
jgi:hypothetical protein